MTELDIIVTRYNEPWNVCRPFFDSIKYQTCADFDKIVVTLVQDGEEFALNWNDLLKEYPYKINIITIKHSGTAIARNTGMKKSSAPWIMFCDIDDMFADVCSLSMILSQFPVKDYDLIWGKFVTEEKWSGGHIYIQKNDESCFANTDCKFYRREFLEQNHLQFDPRVPLYYDYMFNAVFLDIADPFRVCTITTDFYMYLKKHRVGSMRQTVSAAKELVSSRLDRDIHIAEEFIRRGMDFSFRKRIAHAICSEYFRLYNPDEKNNDGFFSPGFIDFYRNTRDVLNQLTTAEFDVTKEIAETEVMSLVQAIYNEHKLEYYLANDTLSFDEWRVQADREADKQPEPVRTETKVQERTDTEQIVISNEPYPVMADQYDGAFQIDESQPQREPRVVVYCGTYNTYLNMLTSAKSLLWHTKVDKVYFLIEDAEFPYELPDIIECINVKDQQWFPETGPNYNNSWSYMCMMRAAFTKLIPYDKILSFDIDIVVQEDISCLWDIDMKDYYLAGVAEPQRQKSTADPLYVNFGVVMMNLAKLRADGVDDQIISALNTTRFGCPEQDAFNRFCAWHIYQLKNDYNATVHSHITGECEKERIIHYAGIKFWRHFGQVKEYGNKPWDTVMARQATLT